LQGCEPRRSLGVKARRSSGVISHTPGSVRSAREYEGVNPYTPKTTPTLGDGVPVETSKSDFRGQNSMSCGVFISLESF